MPRDEDVYVPSGEVAAHRWPPVCRQKTSDLLLLSPRRRDALPIPVTRKRQRVPPSPGLPGRRGRTRSRDIPVDPLRPDGRPSPNRRTRCRRRSRRSASRPLRFPSLVLSKRRPWFFAGLSDPCDLEGGQPGRSERQQPHETGRREPGPCQGERQRYGCDHETSDQRALGKRRRGERLYDRYGQQVEGNAAAQPRLRCLPDRELDTHREGCEPGKDEQVPIGPREADQKLPHAARVRALDR